MKNVVVLGAGLSSNQLISYLEDEGGKHNWQLKVVDRDLDLIKSKTKESTQRSTADLSKKEEISKAILGADLVVSMLPARMHLAVAELCLEQAIHLATASYLSPEIKALNESVIHKKLIFLNECGLDPGLDHLSAMEMFEDIRSKGGEITEFESFTGGLVAPDCEDNPWRYKFTWNPRNVVLASQGGAVKFLHNGRYKYIPYHRVFRRTEIVQIEGYGKFEGYANRDSLKYRETYGLEKVQTMYRGTFRRPGFSKAWNCLVQLGATDDSYVVEDCENMSHRDFVNTFLAYHPTDSVELKLKQYLKIDQDDTELWEKLESIGLFSNESIGLSKASPAQILQHILQKSWSLKDNDRDMIVMWHKITYQLNGKSFVKESSMVTEGESNGKTAMARTVGIPLAIACKLILLGKIEQRGCVLPVSQEFYAPILKELEGFDIHFNETEKEA
ncbi:MAG: saccharopine dehydrogenase NADP-binding domain-containing protein [Bacteroidia bacterium]